MKMTICNISLAVALSLSGCTASEKTQMNDLGKDTSNSLKTLGKDVDKVGQAIKSSTKDQGKDNSQGGKDSKQSSDLEKKASNAMNFLSKESDKAEHAISIAVKGHNNAASKSEKGMNRPANR